uniref:Pilus assembly protein n=1 Tax=Ammonifex degensii TaxID=42838 RepID=A0A7C1J7Q0_9THEO
MRHREERGQATVELALVLPVLILILFGIMEFGRLFSAYLVITNAAREGARLAAVGGDDAAVVARVVDAAGSLDRTALSVTVEPPASDRFSGTQARVTVSYSVYLLTPVLTGVAPNPFPLRAQAVMRVE